MSETTQDPKKKELWGHPIGLYVLFLTEMWERFSYYGMRAILTIYMAAELTDARGPGLDWSQKESLMVYGWYVMLVYLLSIPGGILADRLLGQRKTVLIGAFTLVAGHGVLAVDAVWAFFTGLILIILGVGMLKPNISTMVGGLYKEGDIRRDKGFSIFYIGINLGSLLATTSVGLVINEYGWHAGFGMAGVGMLLGLLVYLKGQKYLEHVGNKPVIDKNSNEVTFGDLFKNLFKSKLHLGITLLLVVLSFASLNLFEGVDRWGYVALFIFLSFLIGILMMIYQDLKDKVQKDRFLVILITFLLVIVFWGAFEQAGGLMSLYTESKTDRMLFGWEVPTPMFQSLNAGFIVIFAVSVAGFWARRKLKSKEASSIFKMAVGTIIMGLGFIWMVLAAAEYDASGSSGMYWLVLAYLFHTIGELSLSPVSLSFVTKLAPVKYASLMMGLYFAATGLGGKLAGVVGESASDFGEYSVFAGITIFTVIFALLVIALLKPLKRLTHGAEEAERDLSEEQSEVAGQ